MTSWQVLVGFLFAAGLTAVAVADTARDAVRVKRDFSQGWKFQRTDEAGSESTDYQGDSRWEKVDLPHTWNTEDVFDDEPGYYRGIGWYRKTFAAPQSWKGKRIVLRFEAACQVATVWVNNRLVGMHKGSFTPFEFDVTELVKPGSRENLVAVRVDNRWRRDVAPHTMDFNFMGGLYREAFLIAKDPVNIVSTRVTTPAVSEAEAVAAMEIEVRNDGKRTKQFEVLTEITGPGLSRPITLVSPPVQLQPGRNMLVKQKTDPVRNPKLWSPEEPNLYSVSFRLRVDGRVVDDYTSPLGFRWFRFDPQNGFFLNGKHLKLRGVNRHDDYPGLGWALPHSRQIEDLKLIKRMGANFIRTAHYPQHPIVLETCDKLGLLVWEEVPFDGEGPKEKDLIVGAKDYADTLKQMLREMIRRDRNHPSIILWSLGNENINGPTAADWNAVVELTKELHQIAKLEDPTRPTVVATDKPARADEIGLLEPADVVGYNLYYGWYRGQLDDLSKTVDRFRRNHPNKSLIISEYGVGMALGRHAETPKPFDFSEEYGCLFHEFYWGEIKKRPFIAGSLIWNVFDFAVEHRVKNQTIPHMNQKGVFTYTREPKDVYYFYRSQWADEPVAYIVPRTWTKQEKNAKPSQRIRVYSNCDSVELYLNGKTQGKQQIASKQNYAWQVTFKPGENELRVKAYRGKQQVTDRVRVQYAVE